jgi:hypothetical protein
MQRSSASLSRSERSYNAHQQATAAVLHQLQYHVQVNEFAYRLQLAAVAPFSTISVTQTHLSKISVESRWVLTRCQDLGPETATFGRPVTDTYYCPSHQFIIAHCINVLSSINHEKGRNTPSLDHHLGVSGAL